MAENERQPGAGFSSPPCLMHEFAAELVPQQVAEHAADNAAASEHPDWAMVKAWRAQTRAALLEQRAALPPVARREASERATERLLAEIDFRGYRTLGVYWPIRGELDVRDVARRHIEAGGIAALPVVTQKNAPVEFWRWEPGMRLQRGFWNIPIPASPERVRPDLLIIPLVGFDAAGFRLGYGGGYYDRTLAALTPLPPRIGIGYVEAALPTIHPQKHDVPMSLIVTEHGVWWAGDRSPRSSASGESC